jgi:hypothetical protein
MPHGAVPVGDRHDDPSGLGCSPELGPVLIGQVTRFVRDPAGRPDYDPPGNWIASARHGIR